MKTRRKSIATDDAPVLYLGVLLIGQISGRRLVGVTGHRQSIGDTQMIVDAADKLHGNV